MRHRRIGVVGAGTVGAGVAQSLAQTGHTAVVVDLAPDILDQARTRIEDGIRFAALFDRAIRGSSHSAILSRIEFTTDLGRLADADLVVENATESRTVKEAVYPELDRVCRPACVLAANTSAIPIHRLAATTRRPDRVIGVHFMNPVFKIATVEVVRGRQTSDETVGAVEEFLAGMGKRAVVVNDAAGFVANRVLMLAINEAILVVQDGVAGPEAVDEIFVRCLGHKTGPLATADLIGLDTVLLTLDVLHQEYADDKFRPCPLLRQMVDAGRRGRKSGRGFFEYGGDRPADGRGRQDQGLHHPRGGA
ncbi:3-hydroxyacyl-CoA dehydrogenase family protein [Actinoplanes sp. NPDC049265]|uniref:3-hydroxyacyl-CoA dehydrogenase family protein n=1 Tax=Actinoplanes sp. NPDC049265 TaxID=3363902 RepID=UPI003720DA97